MTVDSRNAALEEIIRHVRAYEAAESPPRVDLDRVQRELEKVVGAKVESLLDREHVYSHGFGIYFDLGFRPIDPELRQSSRFAAFVRLSWIAPFATIQWRKNISPKESISVTEQELPVPLRDWSAKIAEVLSKLGYRLLSGTILSEILPGRLSELDDSPANVFEVLFSAVD